MRKFSKALLIAAWLVLAYLVLIGVQILRVDAAGPWHVASGGSDGNDCLSTITPCATINGAIGKASPGDTINVAIGTYTGSGNEVVLVNKNVTLSGGWDSSFATQSGMSTIDGGGARKGIKVERSVVAFVEYFTVQNGFDTMSACCGGGLYTSGTATLSNTRVISNTAGKPGYSGGGGGAGIQSYGTLVINNSTIARSNILGSFPGSGINGTVILNNSTVSGNENGDGIYAFVQTMKLNSSTVGGNGGRGINNVAGTVYLKNSLLANNATGDCFNALGYSGTINSLGYNLVRSNVNCSLSVSDLTGIDPLLGPLQNNGGSTLTHALGCCSPAINGGNPAGCTDNLGVVLSTDQRGTPRVGRCDIGTSLSRH